MTRIPVVNKKDEIIGYRNREDLNDSYIARVSGLWVINSKNEVLIAQRALDKIYNPGKWGPSAAGTVEERENYISNIIKEAEEEIGLKTSEENLIIGTKEYTETSHKYFRQMYCLKTDLPSSAFKINKDEVAEIRWIAIPELKKRFDEKPEDFSDGFGMILDELSNLK